MEQKANTLLKTVYEKYQEPLRRLARTIGVEEGDIDDVVQETFISYFQNYSLTWTEERQRAMLIKILKNKCIDNMRKAGRYKKISLDQGNYQKDEEAVPSVEETDPLKLLLDEEAYEELKNSILNIRKDWREIAIMYFMEEKSIKEICEKLSISGDVCRSRIYRVKSCLRKILGPRYSN